MADYAKTPAIRFAGFTDAWEQRKLGEIAEIIGGGTPDTNNAAYWDGDIDWYAPAEMEGKRYATESTRRITELGLQHSSARMLPAGRTVLFTSRAGIGKMAILQHPAATNQGFQSLVLRDGYDPYFVYSAGSIIKEKAEGIASGSTFLEVSGKMLSGIEIAIPSMDEQGAIADFFRSLDDLITLHQRKYDKLMNIKKSMLEKMFPRDGANVPEIRFAGFTDAWEQRKVGEILEERDEQAPKSSEYPLMAFIANEGVAPKGDRYDRSALVNDTENKPYKKTEYGDFIYSSNNLETGSIGLNTYGKASISPVYSIFHPTDLADSDFIGRRLVRKDFINEMVKWRQGVIYGQWRIHESDFIKIEIPIPSLAEQKRIGAFFKSLDNLITLHQRERLLMKGNRSTEAGEGTHNQINVLILQLLNNMEISLLRCCHACMA